MFTISRCPRFVATAGMIWLFAGRVGADTGSGQVPTLKFFYYDSAHIEWVTSAEPDRLQAHLDKNEVSARLFETLSDSIRANADIEQIKSQMTRWIAREREQYTGYNPVRFRTAEGIVAYLRAHDFSVDRLVKALIKRSAASDVELVIVHLVNSEGDSSFQLKVILPDDGVGLTRQGFNVPLRSQSVSYTSVVYALGVALYELHEIINTDAPDATAQSENGRESEELPLPEIVPPTQLLR